MFTICVESQGLASARQTGLWQDGILGAKDLARGVASALTRRPGGVVPVIACVWAFVLAAGTCPAIVRASPSDCIGSSADGKATCTAPNVSGYTYTVCNASELFVSLGRQAQCDWSVLGVPSEPDDVDGGWLPGPSVTTDPYKVDDFIACMEGVGPLTWAAPGDFVGTTWCAQEPIKYRYGMEVVGVSQPMLARWSGLEVKRKRSATCPRGATPVGADPDFPDYCIAVPKCDCETKADPMGIVNGDQNLDEVDIPPYSDSPLGFARHYSSTSYYRPVNAARPATGAVFLTDSHFNPDWDLIPGFGDYWRHTFSSMVLVEGGTQMSATVLRPSGVAKHFYANGHSALNEDGAGDTLTPIVDAGGARTGWWYRTGDALEKYSSTGALLSIQTPQGRWVSLSYFADGPFAGMLERATDDVGRFLAFGYNAQYQLSSITDVAQNTFSYGYSGLMLGSVTYPDLATRSYLYHENPIGANGDLFGMTGIVDELGKRYATYGYETGSTPAYTELAGGVENATRTVIDGSHVAITDPLGSTEVYATQLVQGVSRTTSAAQPAGSGSDAGTRSKAYDGAGNVSSFDNAKGERTCRVSDQVRLLETLRVEGLTTSQDCAPVESVGVKLPVGSRMTSTVWHPTWRLQARVAEPLRITTYVYNGQPDPTAAGSVATCAPATAVLMDGSPIAVLCRKIEQATTDADGSLGFAATAQAGVPLRAWAWTYNALAQPLTATDPRGKTTTFQYYGATSFSGAGVTATGHTMGDLQSATDPLHHTTNFTSYNLYGQLLQMQDPNGVATTNVYDGRRRLRSTTTGADATSYDYDAAGQLKTVTLPSGLVLTQTYDDAHRLTGVSDSAGDTISYTLDAAGNRIGEQVRDAGGALARNVSRSFDRLGRVQSVTGAAQ